MVNITNLTMIPNISDSFYNYRNKNSHISNGQAYLGLAGRSKSRITVLENIVGDKLSLLLCAKKCLSSTDSYSLHAPPLLTCDIPEYM